MKKNNIFIVFFIITISFIYAYDNNKVISENYNIINKMLSKNLNKIEILTKHKFDEFNFIHFSALEKKEYLSNIRFYLLFQDKRNKTSKCSITTDKNGVIYSFGKLNRLLEDPKNIISQDKVIKRIGEYVKILRKDHDLKEFKITEIVQPDNFPEKSYWSYYFHKVEGNYLRGEWFSIDIGINGEFMNFITIYTGIDYKCSGELKVSREEALKTAMNFLIDDLGYKEKDITIESLDSVSNSPYFTGLTGKDPFYVYPNNFKYMLSNKLLYLYKEFFDKPKKEGRLAWVFGFDIRGYSQWVMNLMVDAETGEIIGGY